MTIQEAYKSPHLRVGVRGKEGGRGREGGGIGLESRRAGEIETGQTERE